MKDASSRTREKDLVVPALRAIRDNRDLDGILPTGDLAFILRGSITPTPADKEILKGRGDDRLSQVIRNLVSHRTLEKKGLATYHEDLRSGRKGYRLTEIGEAVLLEDAQSRRLSSEIEGQMQLPFNQS